MMITFNFDITPAIEKRLVERLKNSCESMKQIANATKIPVRIISKINEKYGIRIKNPLDTTPNPN